MKKENNNDGTNTRKKHLITPFLKWVGGKRQLLPHIKELIPSKKTYKTYMEPFIGGGAVFFDLQPSKAIINDYNKELINAYNVIKDKVDFLIKDLEKHKNEEEYFYTIRGADRIDDYSKWSDIQKASRLIYLNKTCYNGLYRVNSKGQFNTPFGKYRNPNIVNKKRLHHVSEFLNSIELRIYNQDYREVLELADQDTFIYLDPPYYPLSNTSSFTSYTAGGWGEKEQIELKMCCDELNKQGIRFLLSNSSAPFIKELYKEYNISYVGATRSINSKGNNRGKVKECLIKNY